MAKSKALEYVPNKRFDSRWSVYDHSGFMFAFCGKPENGKIHQLTGFEGCREGLAGHLYANSRSKISVSRLRLVVRTVYKDGPKKDCHKFEAAFDESTKAGLKLVNIMEERHRWPLTNMYDVCSRKDTVERSDDWKGITYKHDYVTYLKSIVASSKWLRSPHMLSLFVLLFRLPNRSSRKFGSVSSYEALEKVCKGCKTSGDADASYVADTFKFWDPLMSNFGDVFKDLPHKKAYSRSRYGSTYYDEGISKLCKFECSNELIAKQFKEVMEKAGIK
jgi:hypothetical protein